MWSIRGTDQNIKHAKLCKKFHRYHKIETVVTSLEELEATVGSLYKAGQTAEFIAVPRGFRGS